jgi:hypothetical protein
LDAQRAIDFTRAFGEFLFALSARIKRGIKEANPNAEITSAAAWARCFWYGIAETLKHIEIPAAKKVVKRSKVEYQGS